MEVERAIATQELDSDKLSRAVGQSSEWHSSEFEILEDETGGDEEVGRTVSE